MILNTVLFLLFSCLAQMIFAQTLLQGRVTDAETGEALPFAKVMSSGRHGTLANKHGDFSIMGTEDDTLTISYIGYEKKSVKAVIMPATIRLKPLVKEMGELIVLPKPKGEILDSIRNKLRMEYIQNWDKTSIYFFRTFIERKDSTNEMIEGFYNAFSAVNIGRPVIISGQTLQFGITDNKPLLKTNLQRLFLLGPIIYEENFWNQALQPLGESEAMKKAYDSNFITMYDEKGQKIYKIKLLFNGWAPKEWYGRVVIQGTLFVDAQTLDILHFDGIVLGLRQVFDGVRETMELTFRVDYSHERAYTEVTHISFDGGTSALKYHCLLFNVDEGLPLTNQISVGNLVGGIKEAGYDQSLWEKYDIVRRTEEEERAAVKGKKDNMPKPLSVTK